MAARVPPQVDEIFRRAVACRICFTGPPHLGPALIDVAQPRWIGEHYWTGALRVVIILLNPAAGEGTHDRANLEFKRLILAYRDHQGSIAEVFAHQEREIPRWGNFKTLYLDGFGLDLRDIALANIAWCAERGNIYPHTMLNACFALHTGRLLKALEPHLILLGGRVSYQRRIEAVCADAQVEPVLHYGHRKGHEATRQEIDRVRQIIRLAREKAASTFPL